MPLIAPNGRLDRLGGRLLYRVIGVVIALILVGTGLTTLLALGRGHYTVAMIFAVISAGLLWLLRWCFSSKRRLREAEW